MAAVSASDSRADTGMEPARLKAMRVAAWIAVLGLGGYAAMLLAQYPERWTRALGASEIALIGLLTLLLIRAGRPGLAARVMVYGAAAGVLVAGVFAGSVRPAQLTGLMALILLAGWLLGRRHALIVTAGAVAYLSAMVLGPLEGIVAAPAAVPSGLASIPLAISFILVGVLAVYIVGAHEQEVSEIERLNAALSLRLEELQAEKAHLKLIAENVPALIFHGDCEQRCRYANRQFADFFHGQGVDVTGMHLRDILGAEVYERALPNIEKALGGESVHLEGERKSAQGEDRFLEISLVPERDAEGRVHGFFALKRDVTERREFERALAVSEERFRKLFEEVPSVAVQGYRPDGKVIFWNAASERVYGYSREEALGGDLVDLIIPSATRTQVREAIAGMVASGVGLAAGELDLMRKDGSLVAVYSSHVVLTNAAGERELYCLDVELTERKTAEAALRRNEERLRLATESGGVGIWEWDITSGRLEWNAQLKHIFGWPEERRDLTLDHFVAAIHPEDRARVQKAYLGALEAGREFNCEYRIGLPDGSTRWIVARGHGHYATAGHPVRMIGIGIDVTERRRAEEKFNKVLLANPVAISVARLFDGRYLEVNDAYVREFGWTRDDLIGKSALKVGLWAEPAARTAWVDMLREAQHVRNFEAVFLDRSGNRHFVLLSGELIEVAGETHVIAMVLDVSERKRAEDQVRRLNADLERRVRERTAELTAANRELESFAYSISHDLRAPLRSIDGFSHLLANEFEGKLDPKAQGYLDRVRRAAQRMGGLIDDLLELSRVTRQEMHRVPVDLSHLAAELIEERARAEPQHKVSVWIAPDLQAVGDPQLLRVMMQNLLENAWKYSAKRPLPRIEFGRERQEDEDVFFVRDNGVGFDMKYVDRLFTPFQRLHRPEEFEGTGVGLASVSRVVRRHGGRIWAESAPEQGATFRFTLGRV